MIEELLKPSIRKFIRDHVNDDPFQLAFQFKEIEGVPFQRIAQQILGRQKVKSKNPDWYACDDIIYPIKLSLEQSSSKQTAGYKASLVSGDSFIDLTAGMGVDTWALSRKFSSGIALEQNQELSEITAHNLISLGINNVKVLNQLAEDYLNDCHHKFDLIYLDPARRIASGKVFLFEDCEPNIVALLPLLKSKSEEILIKTSPLMDIDQSISQLTGVTDVHIVSVNNDCKEVLYHITQLDKPLRIHTINFTNSGTQKFDYDYLDEKNVEVNYSETGKYLYEPNSAILKAGAFKSITTHYKVGKLHPNTHLYTSNELIANFPGRIFNVNDILPYSKKEIKGNIDPNKANITVRNFPDSVEKIRKKLGLKDGGDVYLFAFTNAQNKLQIAHCTKVNKS